MATFTLTTGVDAFVGGPEDNTVNGTAGTLNPGDTLIGGSGNDVLALYGSGIFNVDQLASFTGFEGIALNNFTTDSAYLYLDNQPISVATSGSGESSVFLGSAAITFQGGSGYNHIYSASVSNWNAGNVIDGGFYGTLQLNTNYAANATYDLTSNTFSHINYLNGYGPNLTLRINSSVASAISTFYSGSLNDLLTTSEATLDLSHSQVFGFRIASSNATGTNFIVRDAGTAFQVEGGGGQDTITAQGFTFTADQRNAIFATASVEKIIDASGIYVAPEAPSVSVSIDNTDVNVAHDTATVTFSFSEAPVGFTLNDASAVSGTLSNLQHVNASTYTATFTAFPNIDIANASVSVTATSSVNFSSAVATFYEVQNNWAPSQMIDGIFTGSPPGPGQDPTYGGVNGWSVFDFSTGMADGADALLTLAKPLPAGEYELTFRIYQNYYGNPGHILGDFALDYTTDASPSLSSPQTPVSIQSASSSNGTTFSVLSPGQLLANTNHNSVGTDTYTVAALITSASPITGIFLDAIKNPTLPGGGPGGQYGNGNFVVSEFTLDAKISGSTAPFTIDTQTPKVSVSIDNTLLNLANPTGLVTFTFTEAPVAFTRDDTSVVGGTLSEVQEVDSTTYTATFTAAATTDITNASVGVIAGSWQEGNGNAGAGGITDAFTVDTQTPTVSVSIDNTLLNLANSTGLVTFTFSEAPTDFSLKDITSPDGSLSNLSGSGTRYSATFTARLGVGDSAATVAVIDGSYHGAAGNGGEGGSTTPFTIDTARPTIAINPIAGDQVLTTAEAQRPLTISGTSTGAVDQLVTMSFNGEDYTGKVDTNGDWSVTVPQSALLSSVLPDGAYAVTADVSDKNGNPAQEVTQNLRVEEVASSIVAFFSALWDELISAFSWVTNIWEHSAPHNVFSDTFLGIANSSGRDTGTSTVSEAMPNVGLLGDYLASSFRSVHCDIKGNSPLANAPDRDAFLVTPHALPH